MTNPSRGELVPGGLAMVIKSGDQDDLFRMVETRFLCQEGIDFPHPFIPGKTTGLNLGEGEAWLCIADGLVALRGSSAAFDQGWAFFGPEQLMPINPKPDPLEITQHQEQSA